MLRRYSKKSVLDALFDGEPAADKADDAHRSAADDLFK
jgi:hypothetical protein